MSSSGFRLEQLFGSKTRARLLGLFLQNPDKAFFVRELTRKIDAQLNSVRRELQNLVDLGLVNEQQEQKEGHGAKLLADRKKYYTVNQHFLLYQDLRLLFKKVQILLKQNLVHEIEAQGSIDFLLFTGRFMNDVSIPTDLLIVGSVDQKALQRVVGVFESELGTEINYTLMSKEEFSYRRQIADRFLFSILESEKVVMVDRLHVMDSLTESLS